MQAPCQYLRMQDPCQLAQARNVCANPTVGRHPNKNLLTKIFRKYSKYLFLDIFLENTGPLTASQERAPNT